LRHARAASMTSIKLTRPVPAGTSSATTMPTRRSGSGRCRTPTSRSRPSTRSSDPRAIVSRSPSTAREAVATSVGTRQRGGTEGCPEARPDTRRGCADRRLRRGGRPAWRVSDRAGRPERGAGCDGFGVSFALSPVPCGNGSGNGIGEPSPELGQPLIHVFGRAVDEPQNLRGSRSTDRPVARQLRGVQSSACSSPVAAGQLRALPAERGEIGGEHRIEEGGVLHAGRGDRLAELEPAEAGGDHVVG